jgi:hypothetical protein
MASMIEKERERVNERESVREKVCVREKEKLHAHAHTPRMAEPKQRPFARLTLAAMLLAGLLTIWFLASQATVCSLHDVGDGAATVEGLSLQEMPRVGNTLICSCCSPLTHTTFTSAYEKSWNYLPT